MLYADTLIRLSGELEPFAEDLFQKAYANQTHNGDLLLAIAHGFRIESIEPSMSGLMVGSAHIGHAMQSQLKFISDYKKLQYPSKQEYYDALSTSPRETPPADFTTHTELLIYQKVWEMTMFQKQLHQISRLANREAYDWDELQGRTSKNITDALEAIQIICPDLFNWLDGIYDNKIRNAIAHSDFYTLMNDPADSRGILFLKDNQYYKFVTEDEWNIIFSKTLLFQSIIASKLQDYSRQYQAIAVTGGVLIRTPTQEVRLGFTPPNQWGWYSNLVASGLAS